AVFAEHHSPSGRDLREGRPQGVLFLVVDQNEEAAVFVVEGVGAHFTSLDTGAVYGIAAGKTGAGLREPRASETPSVVSTLARDTLRLGGYLGPRHQAAKKSSRILFTASGRSR